MIMSTSSVCTTTGKLQQDKVAMKIFDVIVVGGGLSGLAVGQGLHKMSSAASSRSGGIEWKLLEARPVLGGRLANNNMNTTTPVDDKGVNDGIIDKNNNNNKLIGNDKIDMGGAWIWPFHQPYVKSLVRSLNLPTFPQPDEPSSTRIEGGAVKMIESLASTITNNETNIIGNEESSKIQTNTPISSCTLEKVNGIDLVRLDTKTTNQKFFARRVVFAVPPKILSKHVTFNPPLSSKKQVALESSHTWMAGVTKVALVYPNRFWSTDYSNMGLPRHQNNGPAFQVYDSGTKDGSVSSLTFFALVTKENQKGLDDDTELAKQVATQMANVWLYHRQHEAAKYAHTYINHYVQRWPMEQYISEEYYPNTIHPHPHPVLALSQPEWDGLLEFAGSETDLRSPGVMEGAVGAATRVLQSLDSFLRNLSSDRPLVH